MTKETEILQSIERRFTWLHIKGKHILYIDLKNCSESEFIACTQYIRTVTYHAPYEEIRGIIDLKGLRFSPKMIYYAMQVAKYGSKKVTRRAGIGIGPVVLALFRITRMQNPSTRLFKTYEEAVEWMSL
jgi:hypothetical protein